MIRPTLLKINRSADIAVPEWLSLKPARNVNWRTGHGINGKYAATKSSGAAPTESLLESGYLDVLEWDLHVKAYFVQPVTMRLSIGGVDRSYTPDVFVIRYPTSATRSRTNLIVEVKPRAVLLRDWSKLKSKYSAARDWCHVRDVGFCIATDRVVTPIKLSNIRFLLNYRGDQFVELLPHEFEMRSQIENTLKRIGSTTPRELIGMLSKLPDRQAEYLPLLWNLLTTRKIHANLEKKLTMSSPIWHGSPAAQSLERH